MAIKTLSSRDRALLRPVEGGVSIRVQRTGDALDIASYVGRSTDAYAAAATTYGEFRSAAIDYVKSASRELIRHAPQLKRCCDLAPLLVHGIELTEATRQTLERSVSAHDIWALAEDLERLCGPRLGSSLDAAPAADGMSSQVLRVIAAADSGDWAAAEQVRLDPLEDASHAAALRLVLGDRPDTATQLFRAELIQSLAEAYRLMVCARWAMASSVGIVEPEPGLEDRHP
jgi:hypothetical protein